MYLSLKCLARACGPNTRLHFGRNSKMWGYILNWDEGSALSEQNLVRVRTLVRWSAASLRWACCHSHNSCVVNLYVCVNMCVCVCALNESLTVAFSSSDALRGDACVCKLVCCQEATSNMHACMHANICFCTCTQVCVFLHTCAHFYVHMNAASKSSNESFHALWIDMYTCIQDETHAHAQMCQGQEKCFFHAQCGAHAHSGTNTYLHPMHLCVHTHTRVLNCFIYNSFVCTHMHTYVTYMHTHIHITLERTHIYISQCNICIYTHIAYMHACTPSSFHVTDTIGNHVTVAIEYHVTVVNVIVSLSLQIINAAGALWFLCWMRKFLTGTETQTDSNAKVQ